MNFYKLPVSVAVLALALSSCSEKAPEKQLTMSGLDPDNFSAVIDGKQNALYTLKNANGMEVCVTNFGGRVVSVMVPDKDGNFKDVVLGFDSIADYQNIPSDFGAAIGRYGNRINRGKFMIGDSLVQLETNNVANPAYANDTVNEPKYLHHLHGGFKGWQYKMYEAKEVTDSSVTLVIDSPDGDGNFPGRVVAEVKYTLTADNALDIDYTATTDKPTVINLTNHSYFNLNGDPDMAITNCELQVEALGFTPIDSTFMTTGEIATVTNTPFDFTATKVIGDVINVEDEQLKNGNGFDHNWVLDNDGGKRQDKRVVTLKSPVTGITLDVYTNEPGIQIYTGNFLDGGVTGKQGKVYNQRAAVCLETQHYPDSPNKPQWPSTQLNPGETYKSHCVYKFGVEK